MDALLIVLGEGKKFEPDKILRDFEGIAGVSEIRTEHAFDTALECRYEFGGDNTIVRLQADLEVISMRGMGDASLQMALELQRREENPLLVFNQGYDFDFTLDGVHSLEELQQKIRAAYQEEVPIT